jgi:hypothetical protein
MFRFCRPWSRKGKVLADVHGCISTTAKIMLQFVSGLAACQECCFLSHLPSLLTVPAAPSRSLRSTSCLDIEDDLLLLTCGPCCLRPSNSRSPMLLASPESLPPSIHEAAGSFEGCLLKMFLIQQARLLDQGSRLAQSSERSLLPRVLGCLTSSSPPAVICHHPFHGISPRTGCRTRMSQ